MFKLAHVHPPDAKQNGDAIMCPLIWVKTFLLYLLLFYFGILLIYIWPKHSYVTEWKLSEWSEC